MTLTPDPKTEARTFYREALEILNESGIEYLMGGGFALTHYTGIQRDTKDLDIFCRPHDSNRILKYFAERGFYTEVHDVRWISKVKKDNFYMDIIFDTANNICRVDDTWFEHAQEGTFAGLPVKFIPAEELVWCKCYVQNRERYDGADVNHILLKYGKRLDWRRLLDRIDPHWHLLLSHIILFQFVYPADFRDIIPKWIFDELMMRANEQYDLPPAVERVCRGTVIDNTQYSIDVKEWDYKSSTIKTV